MKKRPGERVLTGADEVSPEAFGATPLAPHLWR